MYLFFLLPFSNIENPPPEGPVSLERDLVEWSLCLNLEAADRAKD